MGFYWFRHGPYIQLNMNFVVVHYALGVAMGLYWFRHGPRLIKVCFLACYKDIQPDLYNLGNLTISVSLKLIWVLSTKQMIYPQRYTSGWGAFSFPLRISTGLLGGHVANKGHTNQLSYAQFTHYFLEEKYIQPSYAQFTHYFLEEKYIQMLE